MGRYVKDEINFHGFLELMRKVHEVTLEQVCEGICSEPMMKLIEKGERLPDKLTRDRLALRMGVSMEGYEDYLTPEEYEMCELRQEIIESIEDNHLQEAADMLRKYEIIENKSRKKGFGRVGKQFILAMEYQLFLLERRSGGVSCFPAKHLTEKEKELASRLLEKAITLTIQDIGRNINTKHLLSDQEINLLIEYLWYQEYKDSLIRYDELISYILSSKMDYIGKVKTCPKAVYYRISKAQEKELNEEEILHNFNLCETAIGTIIGSGRSYYFPELLTIWENLYYQADDGGCFTEKRKRELKEVLTERVSWKHMFTDLFSRYGHNPNMVNFCYIYREMRSYCISDVIKTRRKMMGMTKEQLCDGICSVKTLTRIEYKKAKTQMPIVRELFQRLSLYPEYVRPRIFTNDYLIHRAGEKLMDCLNKNLIEEAEDILELLTENLDDDIVQNYQFVRINEAEIKLLKEEINKEQFLLVLEDVLEKTLKREWLFESERLFLSHEEQEIIYRLLMEKKNEESIYLKIIKKVLDNYDTKKIIRNLCEYEFLLTGYCSFIGSGKKYEESNQLSDNLIGISLKYKRIVMLANNLYNLVWNNLEEYPDKNKIEYKMDLQYCIYLSRISEHKAYEAFFINELKKLTSVSYF